MSNRESKLSQSQWKVLKPLAVTGKLNIARIIVLLIVLVTAVTAHATQPPKKGVRWPKSYVERIQSFTYRRAYLQLVRTIRTNRAAVQRGEITMSAARAAGGITVSGTKAIPVLTAKFNNTGADPYPAANLQQELFDGPWPTGTMTDYYKEISYGQFTVTGTVFPWKKVSNNDTYYEGGAGCNGICTTSKLGEFLKETLDLHDTTINFAQYDNDGPDGVPNSGDDDGYVDFVAFVHPESGGECGNNNIWSHRWFYSGWTGSDYTTNDPKAGGGFIKIDDYVIMPGFGCDGTTMIQIGVFCHEFGHVFGLPDLYDTDITNGDSEGIGNWGLMAGGSWGGDGASPEKPTHMSAWSKEFLGWITPTEVTADLVPATIKSIEDNSVAYKLRISSTEYHLVSNRQKKLFDAKFPGAGLLIWHINEAVINAGLANNTVNADENNKGVDLEEADGLNDLDNNTNRGDAGDVFPGTANKRKFDNTTNPSSSGSTAVCCISDPATSMTANLLISTGTCLLCPPSLKVEVVLDDDRIEVGDETTVRAKVTLGGVPQAGKTVTFSTDDPSVARVLPPDSAVTGPNGQATARVRGESKGNVDLTAEVDTASDKIHLKVPDLSLIGFLFLVVCVVLFALLRKRPAAAQR